MNSRKKLPWANSSEALVALDDGRDAGRDEQAGEHPEEGMGQERGGESRVGDDTEARRRRTRAGAGRCAGCRAAAPCVPV